MIRAPDDASVDLRLSQATLRLKARTTLGLTRLPSAAPGLSATETRLKLDMGTVLVRLRKLRGHSRFLIETPSAITAARGTSFALTADAAATRVRTLEGQVSVASSTGSRELLIGAGFRGEVGGPGRTRRRKLRPTEALSLIELWRLPAETPAVAARITALKGTATRISPDAGKPEKARVGTELLTGTRIRTGPRSEATLRFVDGSLLRMEADTELLCTNPGRKDSVVMRGRVFTNYRPTATIRGGNAVAAVRG